MSYLWVKSNPEKARRSVRNCVLKKKYNITLSDYEKIWESQGGRCAICYQPESRVSSKANRDGVRVVRTLAVDRNHKTSQVRGLLCTRCNQILGLIQEQPDILTSMIEYLKKWNQS